VEADRLTGERLAAARIAAGLSQRSLAATLGVSVRTLQNYESGRFVPYRHLDELSRVLRRRAAWLLHGDELPRLDELLNASRRQRDQLRQNTERLRELSEQLAAAGRLAEARRPVPPPDD
jgi:transcriptional regulator with XRE-family HTH domain